MLEAVIDRVSPGRSCAEARTIPILPVLDARLSRIAQWLSLRRHAAGSGGISARDPGYRRDGARDASNMPFVDLTVHRQELFLKSLHDGKPDPEQCGLAKDAGPPLLGVLMEDCVTAYYSHPWAWDEIGFGGPAYPRGYMRLENGLPEPWEKESTLRMEGAS